MELGCIPISPSDEPLKKQYTDGRGRMDDITILSRVSGISTSAPVWSTIVLVPLPSETASVFSCVVFSAALFPHPTAPRIIAAPTMTDTIFLNFILFLL